MPSRIRAVKSAQLVMLARKPLKLPRVGLALSGGAARGIAQVESCGLLPSINSDRLHRRHSAGALVGGVLASGMALSEIESIGRSLRWRDIGRMTMSRMGVQSNERLENYLRARLPVTRFEDLPIPFAAVATDLQLGTGVVMQGKGDVPLAIRASCAIPGWYIR